MEHPDEFSKEILQEIEGQKKIAIQLGEATQLYLKAANQLKRNDLSRLSKLLSAHMES